MGTPTRYRERCRVCGSDCSGRKMTNSTAEQRAAGAPNRVHVVFCMECGFEATPELTPDQAFSAWDKLNQAS